MFPRTTLLAVGLLLVAACADQQSTQTPDSTADAAPTTTVSVSTTSTPPGQSTTTEATMPATPQPSTEIAIADLAARLSIDPADVEVVSVEEVTWPDGSLGCPEPGMNYTQALVPGSRIVLAAADIRYEYHSGRDGDPFWCPAERATAPSDSSDPSL